jgi:hypothetical protein
MGTGGINMVELWLRLAYLERCPKIFQQLMRTPRSQYFNHGRRDIISEPQENKTQLKFLACSTGKYHSAYSPYALNELNLARTQEILTQYEQNLRSFLSILDMMQ